MKQWVIDEDIRKAETLPGNYYLDHRWYEETIQKVFAQSWHWLGEKKRLLGTNNSYPITLLPGVLDEPLLLTKDRKGINHLLSNVCTHRGKILVEKPSQQPMLRCGYHGRCFGLDGQFRSMPCFAETANFPSNADHLSRLPHYLSFGQIWGNLSSGPGFDQMIQPLLERLSFLPLADLSPLPIHTQDYLLDANWALYIDNFLEGFHIPYVHPGLNASLNMEDYLVELFPWMSLQLGVAKAGEPTFSPPAGHPDFGKEVFAYYWWVFPNMLFNFYPWGLSMNIVEPMGPAQTRIRFRSYAFNNVSEQRSDYNLDQTEMEDEAVVLSVQKGLKSRFYHRGKYSPTMEAGVHHFHRRLSQQLFSG